MSEQFFEGGKRSRVPDAALSREMRAARAEAAKAHAKPEPLEIYVDKTLNAAVQSVSAPNRSAVVTVSTGKAADTVIAAVAAERRRCCSILSAYSEDYNRARIAIESGVSAEQVKAEVSGDFSVGSEAMFSARRPDPAAELCGYAPLPKGVNA